VEREAEFWVGIGGEHVGIEAKDCAGHHPHNVSARGEKRLDVGSSHDEPADSKQARHGQDWENKSPRLSGQPARHLRVTRNVKKVTTRANTASAHQA
jgi:hypothetical protein